jgi:hypothetical protein
MELTLDCGNPEKRTEVEIKEGKFFFLNGPKDDVFIEWNELEEDLRVELESFLFDIKASIVRIEGRLLVHQL